MLWTQLASSDSSPAAKSHKKHSSSDSSSNSDSEDSVPVPLPAAPSKPATSAEGRVSYLVHMNFSISQSVRLTSSPRLSCKGL